MAEYIVKETGYPGRLETEIVSELIRCRDCKYSQYPRCNRVTWWNAEDDFCSRAKRKEGEAEC